MKLAKREIRFISVRRDRIVYSVQVIHIGYQLINNFQSKTVA